MECCILQWCIPKTCKVSLIKVLSRAVICVVRATQVRKWKVLFFPINTWWSCSFSYLECVYFRTEILWSLFNLAKHKSLILHCSNKWHFALISLLSVIPENLLPYVAVTVFVWHSLTRPLLMYVPFVSKCLLLSSSLNSFCFIIKVDLS